MNPCLRGRGRRRPRSLPALALAGALALASALAAPPATAEPAVDLNRAGVEELVRLPGVGDTRARAIVALRRERGGFESVDELLDVKGIGETSLERMRPHVRVGEPEPAE